MNPSNVDFVDSKSILVINPTGKMRQVFVPFRVQVQTDTTTYKKSSWLIVDEVQAHSRHKLLYKIGDSWWQYNLFRLAVVF